MKAYIRSQTGVTLVELLVVVAILGIMGFFSGLFLLKYLPDYYLRSAVNTLSQDIRFAQINALKQLQTWSVELDTGTNSYTVKDSAGNVARARDLSSYKGQIRLQSVTGSPIIFNEEGFRSSAGNATVELRNSGGSVFKTAISRTGAVYVTR